MFFLMLLCLALISILSGRTKSPEFILIMPWLIGSFLFLIGGELPLSLSDEHLRLFGYILFEYLLLFVVVRLSLKSKNINSLNFDHKKVILFLGVIVCLPIFSYLFSVFLEIFRSGSFVNYILFKRGEAHGGMGVHETNHFIYRLINIGMVASVAYFYCKNSEDGKNTSSKFVFFVFFLIYVVSLLEGNRSTLIYSMLSIFFAYYLGGYFSIKKGIVFFIFLITFFSISMPIFRLGREISFESFFLGLRYFKLYAFGSILSFPHYWTSGVDLYWGAYDAIVGKIFGAGFYSMGGKDFFLIDYVTIFDGMDTNVYSGYAVLDNYFSSWAFFYITIKSFLIAGVYALRHKSHFFGVSYIILLSGLALSIYHDYFITSLYFILNLMFYWLLARSILILSKINYFRFKS